MKIELYMTSPEQELADQATARKLALEVLDDLMKPPRNGRTVSRRDLLTGLRAS